MELKKKKKNIHTRQQKDIDRLNEFFFSSSSVHYEMSSRGLLKTVSTEKEQ